MPKVILDTNSLIYSMQKHIDLGITLFRIDEVTGILVLSCVETELKGLASKNSDAKAALSFLDRFEIIASEGRGDDCILIKGKKLGAFILTNDKGLLFRAKSAGLRTLSIKANGTIGFS